jgi:glycosyltransferase involved in cell wall biosynthesis
MKKKILMVGPALSVRGGMSSVAIAIIDNLSSDFEVEFLPTYVEGGTIKAGMAFLSAMRRIRRLARKADVVHVHFSKKGSTFRKAAIAKAVKSVGTPLLLHSHSSSYGFYDELPDYGKQRVREFLGSADRFIALSESWAEHYAEKGARNMSVLPNPVVIPDDVADRSGRDTVTTVFMGAMGDRKGAFDLAEAFIPVAKSRPQARLIMAGNGEVDRVRTILREGGVIDQTEIYDWVGPDERDKLLRRADAFILPSYNEGLPMAMLEAIGYRLPPIVTPVGGIPEVIKDGENGLLVNPGDKEAISAAITRLVDSPNERTSMGAAARKTAEDYDVKKYIRKIEDLYREMSNRAS